MNKLYTVDFQSPIGIIEIIGNDKGISSILFSEREAAVHVLHEDTPQVLRDCIRQLSEYFNGERLDFTIPCFSEGTAFQQKVWAALKGVEYAETKSYRDIAAAIGHDKAVRAVGNANSKNKLTIVVPCHRVIGANGKLTGYAGSLPRKEWLLAHECAVLDKRLAAQNKAGTIS